MAVAHQEELAKLHARVAAAESGRDAYTRRANALEAAIRVTDGIRDSDITLIAARKFLAFLNGEKQEEQVPDVSLEDLLGRPALRDSVAGMLG